jgi:hypothetical protein
MTFKMSEQIIEISKFDYVLCTRLAGISDLTAAEAKYHLSCFSAFTRSADLALVWLSKELEYAADKGHVIKLDDAWDRYTVLAEKAGITLPPSFVSRRATFNDKPMHMVGDIMECVQSLEMGPSERHTLLIPKTFAKVAQSSLACSGYG